MTVTMVTVVITMVAIIPMFAAIPVMVPCYTACQYSCS
jgi:hypothetical protein